MNNKMLSLWVLWIWRLWLLQKNYMYITLLKAQVSFSDHNLSVVRRFRYRRRRSQHRRCRKLFTFSSSSPESQGIFHPNMAKSILGWMGFKFVQMKGLAFFQGEKNYEMAKIYRRNSKLFFSRTTGQIPSKLGTKDP